MQTLTEIKTLLAQRGLKPKHRLGQNFLHDKNQLSKLVDAAQISLGDVVLEVGPGTGTLTEALIDRGANVIACEIDRDLSTIVHERLGDRITLVATDVLERQRRLNPAVTIAIADRPFKLVANLPYQVASPLITTLLIDHPNCTGQFVTIQREVADRLTAKPGTKEYGPLTIIAQALAQIRRIATLSPSCFWPAPQVTSAMLALLPFPSGRGGDKGLDQLNAPRARRDFAQFATKLFTKRRKQLGTIFGRSHAGWPGQITPDQRPDALTVEQHLALWQYRERSAS